MIDASKGLLVSFLIMDSDECKKMAGDRQDPCFSDLDRGWAWVVLVASFGCFFLIGGTMYAVGIIHIALLERYGQELSKTSVVGALHSAVMSIGGSYNVSEIVRQRPKGLVSTPMVSQDVDMKSF